MKCLYGKFQVLLKHLLDSKKTYYEDGVRILLYHNIPSNMLNKFRDHVLFIKQHWGFLNPNDWELFLRGEKKFSGIRVLIRFDDGFISQLHATKEVLDPLGIKAIFFVPVNFIGLDSITEVNQFVINNLHLRRLSEELFPMGWDNLRTLVENGHVIGSHTFSHPCLSKIKNTDRLKNEICKSGDIIEQKLGIKVKWFAYPYGHRNSISYAAYNIARERYTYSVTTIGGLNTSNVDRGLIRRDTVKVNAPLNLIQLVLEGGFDFINNWRLLNLSRRLYKSDSN